MLNRFPILLFILYCSFAKAQNENNTAPKQTNLLKVDSSTIGRDKSRVEYIGLEASESGNKQMSKMDYSLDRVQFYLPVYRSQLINSTLGNNGTAIQDLNFKPAFNSGFNWGFNTFLPYTFELKNIQFYDAQSPFTEASYTQGGKKEAFFRIRHTQNIGKSFNFGIEFQRVNSEGTYVRQATAHSALRLNFWFRPGSERYQAFAGVVYHKGASFENGGITASGDSLFQTNTETNRQLYPVNLDKARNKVFRNGFLLRQTFDLIRPASDSSGIRKDGAIVRLQHTVQYNFNRHSYDDENPINDYYSTILDSARTFVDYYNTQWENEFALLKLSTQADSSKKMHWEAKAFLKQQAVHSQMDIQINDTIQNFKTINQSAGGKFVYHIRPSLKIHAQAEAFVSGFNSGDISIFAAMEVKPSKGLRINVGIENIRQEAVYQLQHFASNFGSWDTSFQKISINRIFGEIEVKKLNLHLRISNQIIGNWVLLAQTGRPIQSNKTLNVLSAQLTQQINLRKWHLQSRLLIQQVNDESQVRLPLIQYQESIFREGLISKTTPWRFGIDIIGCTDFRANAYQTQSGLFYLQDTFKNKGLIQANFYVSVKVRRARIFAMMEHFNAGINGMNAYVIHNYPLPDRLLKLGFNWVFFD
jgi:hypothetical protein